ncbi:MAG: hypothetical protein KDG50_03670 [Chromatiales bacterium]|nr:hypothetical protein [Chromatiales bacterium]
MQKRSVLLGWEMGRGLGHVHKLRLVGEALEASGWSTRYALKFPETAPVVGIREEAVVPAPRWPDPPAEYQTHRNLMRASANFGQTLGFGGFHDAGAVEASVRQWSAMLDELRPALVIGDYAPGLMLAARARVPSLNFGAGYWLPPSDLKTFPPTLQTDDPPLFDEAGLIDNVNRALAACGRPAIDALPQVVQGDVQCACTYPVLDPYRGLRRDPYLGLIDTQSVDVADHRGDRLFIYLHPIAVTNAPLREALCSMRLPALVYSGEAGAPYREQFEAGGLEVADSFVDLPCEMPRTRAVIHCGGHGLACVALLSGRPQLVLSYHMENRLTGQALQSAGVGLRIPLPETPAEHFRQAIHAVANDDKLAFQTAVIGRDTMKRYGINGLQAVLGECERLAG